MIYNGKEYKVISREGAKIGDLVHITSLYDEVCDIHEFITWFDDAGDLRFGNELTDGTTFVVDDDTFKVYRYVKDVEEAVRFNRGDKVKIVGDSAFVDESFVGSFGEVISGYSIVNDNYSVVVDGTYYYFPPASLELIEKQTQPITEELSEKVESNAITLDEAANNLVTSKAWTQPSETNVKEGDYMVITDNNNLHEFEIGEIVKVLEPYSGDDDFHAEHAVNPDEDNVWYVEYRDARFATADEIAAINKPQLTFDRGDHVKILSDIAEGHADFSLDSVVTAQFRTDGGVMVQNLKGDVRKVIADEFLRKATPDETIAAISARYGHGERTLKTQIDDFYDGMSALLVAKNENYGDSFSKQYDKYGMQGVEMRLNDKFMRLEQLIAGQPDKVGESVEDTLKDIIGYSTLALLKINENRTELSA